jgi:Domain of unknown function (DUF1844)
MAENKKTDFVVTDRRKFTIDGEARPDAPVEEREEEKPRVVEMPKPAAASQSAPPAQTSAQAEPQEDLGEGPTAEEKRSSTTAYNASTRQIDERLEQELKLHGGGRKLSDFEMSFEKFVASIYMSALMQLGLVAEQGGQPGRPDIIGARQTIDTLAILAEKTKGNLTDREDVMLQNCLYELRMAYIEVTNAIARGPQPGVPPAGPGVGIK